VQAGGGRAAGVAGVEAPERIAGGDRVTRLDGRRDRLVGGAQPAAVGDADDAAAGHPAGVDDRAGAGGPHRCAGPGGEVDAAVTGRPGLRRRVERAGDPGLGDRPGEPERRDRRTGKGEQDGEQQRHAEQHAEPAGPPGTACG
jgi:hypothetical protein